MSGFVDFFDILKAVSLPNRDNREVFTNTQRIDKINNLLWDSKYKRVNSAGLFFMYAKKRIEEIENPVLISSHIDCVSEITKFFAEEVCEDKLFGTFDNAITNAAVAYLMVNDMLADNVIVAFTGDEECGSKGARHVARYLEAINKIPIATIILDVTDMGWKRGCDFTIENNFFAIPLGEKIISLADSVSHKWQFVPSCINHIPCYVDEANVIKQEALEDESWEYDEFEWECFSLCLPTEGEMHSNSGLYARKSSAEIYIKALQHIANNL